MAEGIVIVNARDMTQSLNQYADYLKAAIEFEKKHPKEKHMQPILIVKLGTMSNDDIALLNANGICTVISEDPTQVKFLDPIPSISSRSEIEESAIALARKVMSPGTWNSDDTRKYICSVYMDILVKGTRLDPAPTEKEVYKKNFDEAKADEVRKIAREEAREERAAAKAQRQAEQDKLKAKQEAAKVESKSKKE